MKIHSARTIMFVLSLIVFGWHLAGNGAFAEQEKQAAAVSTESQPRYVAYYFYTTARCTSCKRIEAWSKESIQKQFADALESETLAWRPVNIDKPENAHFVEDFNLYTKSLVIVEQENGKTVRWKNLENVWHLLRNQEKFTAYVTEEVKAFMENN